MNTYLRIAYLLVSVAVLALLNSCGMPSETEHLVLTANVQESYTAADTSVSVWAESYIQTRALFSGFSVVSPEPTPASSKQNRFVSSSKQLEDISFDDAVMSGDGAGGYYLPLDQPLEPGSTHEIRARWNTSDGTRTYSLTFTVPGQLLEPLPAGSVIIHGDTLWVGWGDRFNLSESRRIEVLTPPWTTSARLAQYLNTDSYRIGLPTDTLSADSIGVRAHQSVSSYYQNVEDRSLSFTRKVDRRYALTEPVE